MNYFKLSAFAYGAKKVKLSFCLKFHTLYAIGVWYYPVDTVMNTFGFTDYEKQWTELTKAGFESNPNITG